MRITTNIDSSANETREHRINKTMTNKIQEFKSVTRDIENNVVSIEYWYPTKQITGISESFVIKRNGSKFAVYHYTYQMTLIVEYPTKKECEKFIIDTLISAM